MTMTDFRKTFFKGTFWGILGSSGQQVLTIISTVILARLLAPEDFGLAAVAMATTGIFSVLTEMGFSQAIVAHKDADQSWCDSIFWFQLLVGILLAVVLNFLSGPIAAFYQMPPLAWIIKVSGLGVVASLAASVPMALIQKKLLFRQYNLILILSLLITTALAIALAVSGHGVWALIFPPILLNVLYAFLACAFLRYWPRPSFRKEHIQRTARFGLSVLGTNFLNYFVNNGAQLIMAKAWSPHLLGIYNFAYRRSMQPYQIFNSFFSGMVFPLFSSISQDRERLRRSFFRLTKASQYIVFPLYALLIVFAPKIIPFVFGPQWIEAVLPFQILAAFILFRTYGIAVSNTYYALKKPEVGLKMALLRFGVTIPFLLVMMSLRLGVVWVAVGALCVDIVVSTWYMLGCYRLLGIDGKYFYRELKGPVTTLGLMLAGILFFRLCFSSWGISEMVPALGGLAIYVWWSRMEFRDIFSQMNQALRT